MARQIKSSLNAKNLIDDKAVIEATFALIAEKGLGKARLSLIAERMAMPVSDLYANYASVQSVIALFLDEVDTFMLKNVSFDTVSKRDMYFDMLMSRFDKLQEYRPGVKRWLKDTAKHPALWPKLLRRWEKSLSLMLDAGKDSPLFPMKKIGLAGIYSLALKEWLEDESIDMAKTMTAIDRALGRADAFVMRFMTKSTTSHV